MNADEHLTEVHIWLRYAREDLTAAESLLDVAGVAPRHICWLAQQAAEKAIKTILVFLQVDFPWHHDLDALRLLLPDDWQMKREHPDLAFLTEWAVETRYPGNWPEATRDDAQMAVQQAQAVWTSVRADFVARGFAHWFSESDTVDDELDA
jgi:HEPN domain-containing protein